MKTGRYHFIPARIVIFEKDTLFKKSVTPIGEDVEKLEPSLSAVGNIKWCSGFGRKSGSSSKCQMQNYHMTH